MDKEIMDLVNKIDEYFSNLSLKNKNLFKLTGIDGRLVAHHLNRLKKEGNVNITAFERVFTPVKNKLKELGYRNAEIADDIDRLITLLKKKDECKSK